mmetsp:Transcript_603/g.1787  ORF Transcript_603/g.1787 Transcript_603/m.1787 type:complete len:104 (+) Transcript_603:395-706(+)
MAMMATIAFDVAEVIGTAIGLEILFNFPLPLGIVISFFDTLLILVLQAWGMRKLEAVVESLLGSGGVARGGSFCSFHHYQFFFLIRSCPVHERLLSNFLERCL